MTIPVKKGAVASRWLRAVQPLLSARLGGALKLATQLTEFLNEDVFADSGRLVGWQGIQGLSEATRLCERAVQTNLRRLEQLGVVVPTLSRGGRTRTNCYELKMPPAVAASVTETPHAGAGFNGHKPRTPVQGFPNKTPHPQVGKPRIRASETPHAGAPEQLKNYNRTCAPTADTAPGAPRSRANALGPPSPAETGKGLCNGHALAAGPEPPAPAALNGAAALPDDQFGPIDVERLQRRIGPDQFKSWLADLRFEALANGTLTVSVPGRYAASQIGVRFERPLLECAPGGADRLDVRVRQ